MDGSAVRQPLAAAAQARREAELLCAGRGIAPGPRAGVRVAGSESRARRRRLGRGAGGEHEAGLLVNRQSGVTVRGATRYPMPRAMRPRGGPRAA